MRLVNSVFYYLPLDTGAILVGWLSLIVNMFTAIFLLPNILQPTLFVLYNMVNALLFSTLFVHIASCIVTIIGASKKNPDFMVPWLFGQVFEIIILAFLAFYIFLVELPHYLNYFLAILVYIVFQIYFWVCIYSLYFKLDGDRRREAYNRMPKIRKDQTIENTDAAIIG